MDPPYKPLLSEVRDLPFSNDSLLRTSVEQFPSAVDSRHADKRDIDTLLRQSVEQNARYREVLTERMTACEEQSRTLRDLLLDKFSFLEKEFSAMKITLQERQLQVQQESRRSIDDVTHKMELLRADVSREIDILPEIVEDTKTISALQERLMGVQKEFAAHKEDTRAGFATAALKSDIVNLTARQDSSSAQLIDFADTFKKRLNQCEQKSQADHDTVEESVRTFNDALKQRIVQVQSNIVDDVRHLRKDLGTVEAVCKRELDGLVKKVEEISQSQFTMSECLMSVQNDVKQETEQAQIVADQTIQAQVKLANRMDKTEIAIEYTKDINDRLDKLVTDVNRISLANESSLAGVENSMDRIHILHSSTENSIQKLNILHENTEASIDKLNRSLKVVEQDIFSCTSTVKNDHAHVWHDILEHKTHIDTLQNEIRLDRSHIEPWTERIVELQNLVGNLQDVLDCDTSEGVFASQIQQLQEALQTTGVHTEARLQRIEKVVQALRLQSDIEHTLQEVKLGTQ